MGELPEIRAREEATKRLAAVSSERDRPAPDEAKDQAADPFIEAVVEAQEGIDTEVGTKIWLFNDPERRKALSRARDFLQRILDGALADPGVPREAAAMLIGRVAVTGNRYGRENAWDLAEALRAVSFSFQSDAALVQLLKQEQADQTGINHASVFGAPLPADLLASPPGPGFRARALAILTGLHDARVDRVRHDRARDKLWQHFVWKLIPVTAILFTTCLVVPDPYLPIAAGAVGSMLSAIYKLRDGEHRIRQLRRSASFILLQPLVGAIAALVMVWIGAHRVLNIDDPSQTHLLQAFLGFAAGFSEPFFLGTIGRLTDLGTSTGENGAKPVDRKKRTV